MLSGEGEDDTKKRSSKLEANIASCRAELEAAEVELAQHRSQIAEYVIPDEAELNALVLAIEQDVEGHMASDKPFVRKLASAVGARFKAQQALAIAEEAARDVDLTPGQLKAEMRVRLDEQERAFARERDTLNAEVATLRERLVVIEAAVLAKFRGAGNGTGLLNEAALTGNVGLIRFVLANGWEATTCCTTQLPAVNSPAQPALSLIVFPALHQAAWKGQFAAVEFLLDNGALPHLELAAFLSKEQTPLKGVVFDWPEISRMNSCTHVRYLQLTPLQLAAYATSLPTVELLLARGAKFAGVVFRVPNGADGDLVVNCLCGACGAGALKPEITRV